MDKLDVGERVYRYCTTDGMSTEHVVIESTYTDTNAFICTQCQSKDEELA